MKKQHGGSRPVVRPDDGRLLNRKMQSPIRATITFEQAILDELKVRYGRNWQNVVRAIIAKHLE